MNDLFYNQMMPKPTLRNDGRWMLQLPRQKGIKRRPPVYGNSEKACIDNYNAVLGLGECKVRPGSISEFYITDYVEWKKSRVSKDSFNRYDSAWQAITGPELGWRLWSELDDTIVANAFKGHKSNISLAKTGLMEMAVLAISRKKQMPIAFQCPTEVKDMIKPVQVPKSRPKKRFDTGENAAKMLAAAEKLNHWTEGFIYICSTLGTRKGEACGVKITDMNPETFEITLTRQRNHTEGEREKLKGREVGETRPIALPEPIFNRIMSYFRPGAIYLVTYEDGRPPPTNHFDRYLKPVEEEAGVIMTPHDCRSAAICNLVDAGVDDAVIMDIVGHGSIAMIRWYRDIVAKRSRVALARLEASTEV